MKCTHPVLYQKDGKLVCHVCGEEITEEKPVKKPVKRTTKKNDD